MKNLVGVLLALAVAPSTAFKLRAGAPKDALPIAATLLSMKMNPLGVDHTRFIVAESEDGERIGFGQIRRLGDSSASDASVYDARPGTGDIEADADDDAWDDFAREADDLLPTGFVMPWSDGYKQLEDRAALQRARRKARVAQATADAEPLWELASIFVQDEWRSKGIGSALVRRLLEQHEQSGRAVADMYLLTLEPTVGWYERFGFCRVEKRDVPQPMAFEVAAGEALSALLGNQLCCMRGGASSPSS